MEPWDGPASIAFTDGIKIGAVLDRNGLGHLDTTDEDGLVVMSSEVACWIFLPRASHRKQASARPQLSVDTEAGRIVDDEELKQQIATEHPYRQWLKHNVVNWTNFQVLSAS